MLPVSFVGSLCKTNKIHAVLCSKISDPHEIEVHDIRAWKLFIFRKFSDFYHTSRLSTQKGKICLQKYSPIGRILSITNYWKQNAIDYQPFDNKK